MLNWTHHVRALRAASSVVRGATASKRPRAVAPAWAALGMTAALIAPACDDSATGQGIVGADSGADSAAQDSQAEGDTGADTFALLEDIVFGTKDSTTDTGSAADVAAASDGASGPDGAGEDIAEADAGPDSLDPVDTSDPLDTAGGGPDSGGDTAEDATEDTIADAGSHELDPILGCTQPTGIDCADEKPCPEGPDPLGYLCLEEECREQDWSNEKAMACCQEEYAKGNFTPVGCNPWGPPAPPLAVAEAGRLLREELELVEAQAAVWS